MAGLGGFIGSSGRYIVGRLTTQWLTAPFPIGTLLVNIIGCLLIGILVGLSQRSNILSQNMSTLLITGFCGGFTTFSTFSNETLSLMQSRQLAYGITYILASVLLGIFMVWIGKSISN